MSRPQLEVADIIRSAGTDFIERNRYWLRWIHIKVLRAIARCRTAALGGHIEECTSCGHRATISYNSCRNWRCPKCQTGTREHWIAGRRRELLPTSYVHVVLTLPPQLALLALQNRKSSMGCCFGPAQKLYLKWRAIPLISAPMASSACSIPGTRNSNFIPMSTVSFPPADFRLISDAGFNPPPTLLPSHCCTAARVSSQLITGLKSAFERRQLHLARRTRTAHPSQVLRCLAASALRKDWIVYSKPPFGRPSTFCHLSAAVPTASPSPTIAWSHWRMARLPFAGVTPPITINRNS